MQPLETNRRVLTWLCGLPPNESDSKRQKIGYIAVASCVILSHFFCVIAIATFLFRMVLVDLELTLFALINGVGAASMLYQSIITIRLRREIASIFETLSDIYNQSKSESELLLTNIM